MFSLVFIDSKGQIVNEDINQRTIGIALPELRKKNTAF